MTVLSHTLTALTAAGFRPAAAAPLSHTMDAARAALALTTKSEIPAYSETGNPDILPEFDRHATELFTEVHRLVGGSDTPQLEFVRRHAARTAEQNFPLEATLHAYRCGHRVLSSWLRNAASPDAIAAVNDFVMDYVDTVSTIATAEYVRRTRQLSEAEADRRSYLLTMLLKGYDESDRRVTRLLRSAGYLEQRQSYCVILVRPVNLTEMDNPARANRLLAATRQALGKLSLRTLFGLHDNHVVAVASATRRQSGWTAPQTALAERVAWPLLTLGNAVLVGVSADVPSTALIPKALHEAELALDTTSVGERVVKYGDIPLRKLLLHLAEGRVQAALPGWTDTLAAADNRAKGKLVATLRAYASADMNVQKAAKTLAVHPNTIYARMQKVEDLTGLNATRFHALSELLLAMDCVEG
jgi:hypothetical protein